MPSRSKVHIWAVSLDHHLRLSLRPGRRNRVGMEVMVMATRKIGRDARTGRIIPVREAERRKSTAVVETIKVPKPEPKGKGMGK